MRYLPGFADNVPRSPRLAPRSGARTRCSGTNDDDFAGRGALGLRRQGHGGDVVRQFAPHQRVTSRGDAHGAGLVGKVALRRIDFFENYSVIK